MTIDYATDLEEHEAALRDRLCRVDGAFFLEQVLGYPRSAYYDKQTDILNAVLRYRKTAVCGANGTGKDWSAGQVVLQWMYAFRHLEPMVIVSGPTLRQVKDVVFSEARRSYLSSKTPLGGRFQPSAPRWNLDARQDLRSFAMGYSVSDPLNLQGLHSPKLLVIVTEAHNVPQDEFDALDRLNPSALLLTGNPLADGGEFYEAFHSRSDIYHTIQISAFDTPNVQERRQVIPGLVTWETVQSRLERYGEDNPLYIASTLGRFPRNIEGVVVDLDTLEACVERKLPPRPEDLTTLSADIGYTGDDPTVVYARRGHQCRQVWEAYQHDTEQVAGRLSVMASQDPTVEQIVVDATGIGAGVYDKLHHNPPRNAARTVSVHPFKGGEAALNRNDYVNAISEAYLEFAKACRDGIVDLDDNSATKAQLSSRRKEIQGDRRERIEPKDKYKSRTGRSPDNADALVMLYSPKRFNRWEFIE